MSIPSQLPIMIFAGKAGNFSTLSLCPQQTVTATVVGVSSDGSTQVQVGRQTLNLTLPAPALRGTTLTLQAQGIGSEQRLVLVQQIPPASMPAITSAVPNSVVPPVIASPLIAVQSGALQALGLRPGQPVLATVLGAGADGSTQVHVGGQILNITLSSSMPMPSGATLMLQAQGTGAEQRLIMVQQAPSAAGRPISDGQYAALAKTALTQMVQSAVARQDSMGGLITALSRALGGTAFPDAVVRAAQHVLDLQLPLSTQSLSGQGLQKALLNSGLFQEALLAAGAQTLAGGDIKTALLTLRQALVSWLGYALPPAQPGRVPPPVRGTFSRVALAGIATDDFGRTPEDIGKTLLERTEAALSRLRLHQHASLPDIAGRSRAEWTVDLPVLIGSYQTMMQFQVQRDDAGTQAPGSGPSWQMRFAIDLPIMGEVGAQVTLRGGLTSVMLWALQPETAATIEANLSELTQALVDAGLNPSVVHCRQGEPQPPIIASGHFMDRLT